MFTDPDSIGADLPDRDPSTDCEFRECEKPEAGAETESNIDAVVLEVFGNE